MSCFRELEMRNNDTVEQTTPLEDWYKSVRDLPFEEFNEGDLCRACRQELFLEHVLPFAFERLTADPEAGSCFDGELASVIARIKKGFWEKHPCLHERAKAVLNEISDSLDQDVSVEVATFLRIPNGR